MKKIKVITLYFLFHISRTLDFFHGETMDLKAMKSQRRMAMFTSLRQPLTNSKRRLMRRQGILAAMRGFRGWLGGRIWRLQFGHDLIL